MKFLPLLVLLLAIPSCANKIGVRILHQGPNYVVGETSDGMHVIIAPNNVRAKELLDAQCEEKDRVCTINSVEVLYRFTVASDGKQP